MVAARAIPLHIIRLFISQVWLKTVYTANKGLSFVEA